MGKNKKSPNQSFFKYLSLQQLSKKILAVLLFLLLSIYLFFKNEIHNFFGFTQEGMTSIENSKIRDKTKQNTSELVYLYMNGCGHCEKFTPEFEKFASKYKGSCKVSKYERGDKNAKKYIEENDVKGFPTILLINNDKVIEFEGERTEVGLLEFIESNTEKTS